MTMRSGKNFGGAIIGWLLLLPALAILLLASPFAQAQSDPVIQTVRTFTNDITGTTDVIDPAASYVDVTVTFTDVNTDPLGSKPITAFGFQENGGPPHTFKYDHEVGGPFLIGETLTFIHGETSVVQSVVDTAPTGVLTVLLAGAVPHNDDVFTGSISGTTASVYGTVNPNAGPPGWTSTGNGLSPIPQLTPPAGGSYLSGWFYINTPVFPFSFTYRLNAESPLTDLFDFSGRTLYRIDSYGGQFSSPFDDTQSISPSPTLAVYRLVTEGLCLPQEVTSLTVQLTIKAFGDMSATSELGLIEVVPTGWLVVPGSVSGANVPENIQINASGNLEVSYATIPVFPASFSYQITIPTWEAGTKSFTTFAQYRLGTGDSISGPTRTTNMKSDNAPTLSYIGVEPMTLECGDRGTSLLDSWRASDIEDGNLSSRIVFSPAGKFTVPGSYPINISVTDSCGNTTSEMHTVNVADIRAPVIRIICTDTTINCGMSCSTEMIDCDTIYLDAGASAIDACEGDLTNTITAVSTVPNPTTPGNWTVTYTATDSSGNTGRVVRYVIVSKNCPGGGGAEGESCVYVTPNPSIHSADRNADNKIGLTDLLRVLQFFNLTEYHCDCMTEDGFATCFGDRTCTPHSSDFDPQDWRINLHEVLRIIQFFNLGAYHYCPGVQEDGFCPGTS